MKPTQARCRFRPWGWLALAALVALTGQARLSAQDEPVLLLSDKPKAPEKTMWDEVLLRPNREQPFYLFVNNPGNNNLTVTVVVRGGPADNETDVLRSKPVTFTGPGTLPVSWETGPAAPAAPAAPPAAGAPPPAPAEVELKDPSKDKFYLVMLENNKPVGAKRAIVLQRPEDYLVTAGEKQCTVKFDGKARVTAKVTSKDPFVGKAAPVQLVLDPARIPGLVIKETTDAATARAITESNKSVELYQGNLSFDFPENKELGGPVTLTVDGFGRALTYRTKFKEGVEEEAIREDGLILRIQGERYGQTGGKYRVELLVDNAELAWNLEVGLDRNKDGTFEEDEVQVKTGAREQLVFARPSIKEKDALVFRTVVKDWAVDLDASGIFGTTSVRLQLLDEAGKPITVYRGKKVEPVVQTVTFDNSEAEITRFGPPPKKTTQTRNAPIELQVDAEDGQSRIKEVLFFVGKSTKEIPMPPGVETVAGTFLEDDQAKDKSKPIKGELNEKGTWVAQLPAPTEKGGKIPVAVQVTNGAGIKSFGTITLDLVEPAKAGEGGAGGGGGKDKESITGKVTEDGRPQPNVPVTLKDSMGNAKATTKTDKAGRYVFKDIPAGTYKVTATKTASKTEGEVAVTVDKVTLSGVDIPLGRK